jgi:Matrixin
VAAATPLQLCYDRVIPEEYAPARTALERAMAEGNVLSAAQTPQIDASTVASPAFLAVVVMKMWENGRELKCRFLDGSATQRRRVEEKAHLWEKHANIKFKFVRSGTAEIRISFRADPGSWSALGTDALIERYFPRYQPTMNFGWLDDDTVDEEYERVVVHEFGHALGCIHEHQNPQASLKWNTREVYRVFSGPPNYWTKEQIDHNVLARYKRTQTNSSRYDGDSIMLYEFPDRLFTDGKGTKRNMRLSRTDKSFIKSVYPGRR